MLYLKILEFFMEDFLLGKGFCEVLEEFAQVGHFFSTHGAQAFSFLPEAGPRLETGLPFFPRVSGGVSLKQHAPLQAVLQLFEMLSRFLRIERLPVEVFIPE